jgi:hypothetical protein
MNYFDRLDEDIVPFHILPRLDGETLMVLSWVSPEFRHLIINNDDLMRKICISTWPSLLYKDGYPCQFISRFPGSYRSFFCQAFPPIDEHHPLPPPPPSPRPVTFFMFSIDVFLQGQREPFYSDLTIEQVSTTDSTLESLLGTKLFNSLRSTHFRMDFSSCGDGRKFFHVKIEGCEEYLKQNMRFSFVVVETLRECAGSLFHPSTCKPVSVKKMKLDGTIGVEVVFETFIPAPVGFYTQMVKCEVKITCSWEEGEEDRFYVDIITFTMYDMNGKQVRSRNGNLIISNAIENGERKINK